MTDTTLVLNYWHHCHFARIIHFSITFFIHPEATIHVLEKRNTHPLAFPKKIILMTILESKASILIRVHLQAF